MLRNALCSALALLLVAGLAAAADKKKATSVSGTFESFADGKLTVAVKGKKGEPAAKKEFTLAADTKVTLLAGEEKKELTAKDGFKDAKAGSPVTITLGEGDKVAGVQIGKAKKKEKQ